jgi:hypothetical protein
MVVGMLFVPQLVRDLRGLGLDQLGRQVELDHLVQLVQQRPLHHRAAGAGIFGLQPLGDLRLQRGQILGAEFLGQSRRRSRPPSAPSPP